MLRASIAAETAGIPSVSLICPGFEGQAAATGRGMGIDGMALALTVAHVDAQPAGQMVSEFVAHTVPQVIAGLTGASPSRTPSPPGESGGEPAALDVVATGNLGEIHRVFTECGWTDGLPVVPPTIEAVERFLAVSGHDPWKLLGRAASSGRDLSVWSVAVNAVMAGCRPEQLPVLLAATAILADPRYGVEHSGNTTGADALMILDGPGAAAMGYQCGQGSLREGAPANTTTGRWLRLYLRNVFGFTADQHDKATFGNAARVLLAEDMGALADIGWAPLSADFGYGAADDVLTMARFNSTVLIGSVVGSSAEEVVDYLADGLVRVTGWDLTHVHGLGHDQYRPLLVLSPLLARTMARSGWSKRDARQALWEAARLPAWRFEALIGSWSGLTAGRPRLVDLVDAGHLAGAYGESDDPQRLVPIVPRPERLMIAVAGDPHRANALAMSNDGPHGWWTAAHVDRSPSTDLVCSVDDRDCAGRPPG